jgi:hypothetical protein
MSDPRLSSGETGVEFDRFGPNSAKGLAFVDDEICNMQSCWTDSPNCETAPQMPVWDGRGDCGVAELPSMRDRWFESISLQRGVRCEPDFLPATAAPR